MLAPRGSARSRRAWIYVLSVLALLVPAGGIAYLGAVSYRDEQWRGVGAERAPASGRARDRRAHRRRDRGALDAADARSRATRGAPPSRATGSGSTPRASARPAVGAGAERRRAAATIASRASCSGGLEDCVRELATRQARVARLRAAQRARGASRRRRAPPGPTRVALYTQLAASTTPDRRRCSGSRARRRGSATSAAADAALAQLDDRFAERKLDGLPVRLVGAVVRAAGRAPASCSRSPRRCSPAGTASIRPPSSASRHGSASRARSKPPPELGARRAALAERADALRGEARAAAGLADDVPAIARDAESQWRGRPAARQPARTLIYRRRADSGTMRARGRRRDARGGGRPRRRRRRRAARTRARVAGRRDAAAGSCARSRRCRSARHCRTSRSRSRSRVSIRIRSTR